MAIGTVSALLYSGRAGRTTGWGATKRDLLDSEISSAWSRGRQGSSARLPCLIRWTFTARQRLGGRFVHGLHVHRRRCGRRFFNNVPLHRAERAQQFLFLPLSHFECGQGRRQIADQRVEFLPLPPHAGMGALHVGACIRPSPYCLPNSGKRSPGARTVRNRQDPNSDGHGQTSRTSRPV